MIQSKHEYPAHCIATRQTGKRSCRVLSIAKEASRKTKIFCWRPNNNDVNIKPRCFLFAHGCCLNDRALARMIWSPPGPMPGSVTDVPGPPSSVSVSLLITITPPQTSELNIQADCHSTFKAYSYLFNQRLNTLECGMRDDSDSDNPVMVLLRPLERAIS